MGLTDRHLDFFAKDAAKEHTRGVADERARLRPLLERCRQVIDTYCDPAQPEILADLPPRTGKGVALMDAQLAMPEWPETPAPRTVTFFVPGVPQPGGSKKGFAVRTPSGRTRIAIVDDAKHNAPWRAVVSLAASKHFPSGPWTGPLVVSFTFVMPRPKGHYGTGRNAAALKASVPAVHTIKPDALKLARSTEDALTGIAWTDDCQGCDVRSRKIYANDSKPGCWITITEFREPTL